MTIWERSFNFPSVARPHLCLTWRLMPSASVLKPNLLENTPHARLRNEPIGGKGGMPDASSCDLHRV